MIRLRSITLIAVFSMLFTIVLIPQASPAKADVLGPTECFPAVLMLKGSGEGIENGLPVDTREYIPVGGTEPYMVTNGHEGARINRLLQAFVNQTDPAETVSKVRFIGIETPSLPVFPELVTLPNTVGGSLPAMNSALIFKHVLDYNDSYRAGAQKTLDFIKEDQQRGCETRYMLVSYSQGVISARLVMNLLNNETDKVISSYAIGDPFQKANGASTSRQLTAANTSPHTSGIGSVAAATLAGNLSLFPDANSLFNQARKSVNAYYNEMNRSNDFMYRDAGGTGPVSRSLCHLHDTVCSVNDMDIEEHTNYFNASTSAGAVDLSLEVEEFDKQVQTLANSVAENPRQRVLTKTPSIAGGVTSYNIANIRPDDLCTWDEGSDGVPETVNVPCTVMNISHTSANPKMTVTVTDSFNIQYTFGSEVEAIDQNAIDLLTGLDPDSWYQFRPYSDPEMCIERWQAYTEPIDLSDSNMILGHYCENPPHPTYAYDAGQVFRAAPNGIDNEVNILWGYDDDYTWTVVDNYPEIDIDFVSSSNEAQNFVPKFLFIDDDVPYYTFRQGEMCLSAKWGYLTMPLCDYEDEDQWFSANVVTGNYGALSIEKDVTPPTDVTGLHVVVKDTTARLTWDHSTDSRAPYVDYSIVRTDVTPSIVTNPTNGKNFMDLGATAFTPKTNGYSYSVRAKDFAGWYSTVPATITFPSVSSFPEPANPEVSSDGSSAILTLPSLPSGLRAEVQRGWTSPTIANSSTYVDSNVNPGASYTYRYRVELADNVFSEWTERVSVRIAY